MSDLGNKEIMASNLQYYMNIRGIDRNKLCDDLGLKYTTVRDWVKGNSYPRIDKIEMLANYFGVSKADLVESKTTNNQLNELDARIIDKLRRLPDSDKLVVDNLVDSLLTRL